MIVNVDHQDRRPLEDEVETRRTRLDDLLIDGTAAVDEMNRLVLAAGDRICEVGDIFEAKDEELSGWMARGLAARGLALVTGALASELRVPSNDLATISIALDGQATHLDFLVRNLFDRDELDGPSKEAVRGFGRQFLKICDSSEETRALTTEFLEDLLGLAKRSEDVSVVLRPMSAGLSRMIGTFGKVAMLRDLVSPHVGLDPRGD